MKRILIIGNSGSGKTTFAKALAEKTQLPLIHLDKLFWCGEWEHLSRDEFDAILQKELEKPEWIIDGNFSRTIPHRLKYCDTVFYFDLPTITCLWGSTVRVVKN
ncbi:MAG: AAA family ATPase [Acutalibacteraceae bacterium]|nr:AAA family ATPase [Acutalibacteraceae bacterium]